MRRLQLGEMAIIVRRVLREAFPEHEFKVTSERSSSGSEVLYIYWTDGPRECDVDKLTRIFESKRFDRDAGKARWVQHVFEGEEVWFGSDFVHCCREVSDIFLSRARDKMLALRETDPVRFERFLESVHFSGDFKRNIEYLARQFSRTLGEVEPRGSATATAILLANPFLHEEAA